MTKYNFCVYIHSNLMNEIPARVAKYSFNKTNPDLDVYIKNLEDFPSLLSYHNSPFQRSGNALVWDSTKHQAFFPVRFLCPENHKLLQRHHRWIFIVDPDIFCLKDLTALNNFIGMSERDYPRKQPRGAQFIAACYKKGNLPNSSAMLVDTDQVQWSEDQVIKSMFVKKEDFDHLMFLQKQPVFRLPSVFNEYDTIYPNTYLLHTTTAETQPWKTGIKYLESELHNKPKRPDDRKLVFLDHPNTQVKECVFGLFTEAYRAGLFTLDEIKNAIIGKSLRSDIRTICNI